MGQTEVSVLCNCDLVFQVFKRPVDGHVMVETRSCECIIITQSVELIVNSNNFVIYAIQSVVKGKKF